MKLNESQQILIQAVKHALHGEIYTPSELPDSLQDLALQHKLLPLVCEGMPSVPVAMKRQAMIQLACQTRLTQAALAVYDHLRSVGAHPLILKGAVCRALYPNPDQRISGDEDIYVQKGEFSRCCKALEDLGLRPWDEKKESWYDAGGTVHIELHSTLFDGVQLEEYPLESLFQNGFSQSCSYEVEPGRRVASFDPHLHLLYLILHAYKHFLFSGFGLRQICDIGLWTVKYQNQIQWERLYQECESVRAVYFTSAVFQIAKDVLELSFEPLGPWEKIYADGMPLLQDVMSAGIYGSADSARLHSAVALGKGSVLRALFPERSYMEERYPQTRGRKTPLPVLWARRLGSYGLAILKKQEDPLGSAALAKQRTNLLRYYKIR